MACLLLILPCNGGAFHGDYSLASGWKLIKKSLARFISEGIVDLAAIDCINNAGIVLEGEEKYVVKGGDKYPSWQYFKKNPEEIDLLAKKVASQLPILKSRYDYIVAYVNVKAYRLALEKASNLSNVPVHFINLRFSPLSFRSLKNRSDLMESIRRFLNLRPEIYFCFPDLADAKVKAIRRLAEEDGLRINVLISYLTIKSKPSTLHKLVTLRSRKLISRIMLDSGAYNLLNRSISLKSYKQLINEYANFIMSHQELFDRVVVPDVPNDPHKTEEYTKLFLKRIQGFSSEKLVFVAQGRSIRSYVKSIQRLKRLNISPGVIGVGGIDHFKRMRDWGSIVKILNYAASCFGKPVHLFGATRTILKRIGMFFDCCDIASWLYDIRFRRRSELNALTSEQATYMAIKKTLFENMSGAGMCSN